MLLLTCIEVLLPSFSTSNNGWTSTGTDDVTNTHHKKLATDHTGSLTGGVGEVGTALTVEPVIDESLNCELLTSAMVQDSRYVETGLI